MGDFDDDSKNQLGAGADQPGPDATAGAGLPSNMVGPRLDSLDVSDNIQAHAGFDPAIHAVGPDGQPKMRKGGGYALKRGRKGGSAGAVSGSSGDGSPAMADGAAVVKPDEAARTAANLTIWGACLLFGEEVGKPADKNEANNLLITYKDYFNARGVPNLPPEVGLIIGLLAYIAPRAMHENTPSRLQKIKEKMVGIYLRFRGK